MQTDGVVELEDFGGFNLQLAAEAGVVFVGKRDDGVKAVVAAIELDHDQDPLVRLSRGREGRLRQKGRHQRREGNERGLLKELAAGGHFMVPLKWWAGAHLR
jgi:hypothetical protein